MRMRSGHRGVRALYAGLVLGFLAGCDGDRTLHGTIAIIAQTSGGETKTYNGTFRVQCVSWG